MRDRIRGTRLDPDYLYDCAVDDQIQRERERQDWRAGDPRFHQDVHTKLFYVCTPEAHFGEDDRGRLNLLGLRDPGWRRLWQPERYKVTLWGHLVTEPDWSEAQRKRIAEFKRELANRCLLCRCHPKADARYCDRCLVRGQ